jgi:hypothetical protein
LRGELHGPVAGSDFDLHARSGGAERIDLRGKSGEGGGGEEGAAVEGGFHGWVFLLLVSLLLFISNLVRRGGIKGSTQIEKGE